MKTIFRYVAALVLLLASSLPLLAQDGSEKKSVAERFESGAAQAKQKAQNDRVKSSLEKAISVLCPGGIPDGSARKAQFGIAIDQYIDGKAADALKTLQALNAKDSQTPPAEFLMAGFSFAVGDTNRGIAVLENNAVKYPDYPGVYLSFAQLALNTNRVSDAAVHAEKVQRLIAESELSAEWREHFAKQYYEIVTNIHLRRKQSSEADQALERLQEIEPNLPFYFLNKAKVAFEAGRNPQTIQYLKQYNDSVESKRLPELTLVGWFNDRGKSDEAEELLLATAGEHPNDADTLLMSADMYMAQEDFAKTLTTIERFEKANSGASSKSVDIKGRVAFAGLSYDVAADHFRTLASRDPKNVNNAIVLALSLIESNDPEKRKDAQVILQRIVTRLPQNSLAVAALGYAYLKNGDKEKAAQAMRRVAMARQGSSEISWFLASWFAEQGQNQNAIKLLKNAVEVKGLFLYRSAARKLLAELESSAKQ